MEAHVGTQQIRLNSNTQLQGKEDRMSAGG
jgi:hypothetical protein